MDEKELIRFLNEARKKCSYETIGEIGERELPGGIRVIGPYVKGSLSYVDRYKGFNWFKGIEKVKESDVLKWWRKYKGGVIDKRFEEKEKPLELFGFLKKAMRQAPKNKPYIRGPSHFIEGDYEYFDEGSGDIHSFKRKEWILYKGVRVYSLEYSGKTLNL